MTWQETDNGAAATPPVPATPTPARVRRPDGLRRAVLTAGIAGALLVTGGVAAVFAASPDPSGSATPSATTDQSGGGTTAPSTGRQGHDGQPCPDRGSGSNGDGSSGGSSGSGGSDGQPAQPSPSTATPAT